MINQRQVFLMVYMHACVVLAAREMEDEVGRWHNAYQDGSSDSRSKSVFETQIYVYLIKNYINIDKSYSDRSCIYIHKLLYMSVYNIYVYI